MPHNGSGVYNRDFNWVEEAANNTRIRADQMDIEMDGFATGLSKCILIDGQQTLTANIPFNGKRIFNLGDATADQDALNRQSGDARFLQIGNNLSDLTPETARTNLGLGDIAVLNKVDTDQIEQFAITTPKLNDQSVTLAKHATATAGDILYYNGGGILTVLPKGSDGEVLSLAAGIPSWVSLPSGVPTGVSMPHNSEVVPDGWLEEDGGEISRTGEAALFAVIGTRYGAGNGTTTFNKPDSRGLAVRGWDHGAGIDPDAGSRTDRGDGTTGDFVGTKQADQIASHRHVGGAAASTTAGHTRYGVTNTGLPGLGGSDFTGNFGANTSPWGGNETRMKNITKMWIIKT